VETRICSAVDDPALVRQRKAKLTALLLARQRAGKKFLPFWTKAIVLLK
jgi:hypothetical protein